MQKFSIAAMLRVTALIVPAALSACTSVKSVPINKPEQSWKVLGSGQYTGEAKLIPIGRDTFFFYQEKGKPAFSFTTAGKKEARPPDENPGKRGKFRWKGLTITPEPMITTGASIPRAIFCWKGLSPWAYAQASLLHDWLFEAHHRYESASKKYDETPTEENKKKRDKYRDYAFLTQNDAADIYAEALRVSMELGERRKEILAREFGSQKKNKIAKHAFDSVAANTKSDFEMSCYHYFTSEECILPIAKGMWKEDTNNLQLFQAMKDGQSSFGSPELQEMIRKAASEVEDRLSEQDKADVREAKAEARQEPGPTPSKHRPKDRPPVPEAKPGQRPPSVPPKPEDKPSATPPTTSKPEDKPEEGATKPLRDTSRPFLKRLFR